MQRLSTIFEDRSSDNSQNSEEFKETCRRIQSSKSNPSYKPGITFAELCNFLLDKNCEPKHLAVIQPLQADQHALGEEKLYGDYRYIQAVPNKVGDGVIIKYTHVLHVHELTGECTLHDKEFAEEGDFSQPLAVLKTIADFKCPVSEKKPQNKLVM